MPERVGAGGVRTGRRTVILETSGAWGELVLAEGANVRTERSGAQRGHLAEWLLPALSEALEEVGWARGDLDAVAVGVGPGRFTGLRVGLATAKGLAVALRIPLIALDSLRMLAAAIPEPGLVAVLSPVGRALVDGALFRVDASGVERLVGPLGGRASSVLEALAEAAHGEPMRLLGEGVRRHRDVVERLLPDAPLLDATWDRPRPEVLARLAAEALARGAVQDPLSLEPVYVRAVDATPPKRVLGAPRREREA